jgi:hypothetical protein
MSWSALGLGMVIGNIIGMLTMYFYYRPRFVPKLPGKQVVKVLPPLQPLPPIYAETELSHALLMRAGKLVQAGSEPRY